MPGELSKRDCPIFPSLPDLKHWEQLIPRENDFERSHALMASACNLSCSTTCGSMAIVRIRRQDLLELFVERTRKKPIGQKSRDRNQNITTSPQGERLSDGSQAFGSSIQAPNLRVTWVHGLCFSCFQGLLHLFFFNLLQGFWNPDLETTSLDFYMSFWVVCFWCGFEKCVIDATTTKKENCLRHSINTPHGKD